MTIKKEHSLMLVILLAVLFSLKAQKPASYTLDTLQRLAHERYPQARKMLLAIQYGNEAEKNANTNWLPKTSVVGNATYQSEVPSISVPAGIPLSIPDIPEDQYKAGVELSQLIFDGGITSAQQSIEQLNTVSQTAKVEAEMLETTSKINGLFTAILTNKEASKVLQYVKNDLQERFKNIKSSTENGMTLKTTMRELEAEIIGIDQKILENKSQLVSLCSTLSILVQETVDTSAVMLLPETSQYISSDFSGRPELKQFKAQSELFDWHARLINRSNLPKVTLFGNGYYGRPGFNMYDSDFRFYGITGLSLKWNIGGVYTSTYQKNMFAIGKETVLNQQKLFELGVTAQLEQQKQEIIKLSGFVEKDSEITAIRSEVKKVAAIQYENGTITTTDYLIKLNAESKAMVNLTIHKIQLAMAHVKYQTLLGKQ